MASTKINVPNDVWTKISLDKTDGSIHHYAGHTNILLVQATVAPALPVPRNNAIAAVLKPTKLLYFNDLVAEHIWALSETHDSVVVVTPKEV